MVVGLRAHEDKHTIVGGKRPYDTILLMKQYKSFNRDGGATIRLWRCAEQLKKRHPMYNMSSKPLGDTTEAYI